MSKTEVPSSGTIYGGQKFANVRYEFMNFHGPLRFLLTLELVVSQ